MKKTMFVLAILAMAAMIAAPAFAQMPNGDLYDNFSLDRHQEAPKNLRESWSGGGTGSGETYWNVGDPTESMIVNNDILTITAGGGDRQTGTDYTSGAAGTIYVDLDIMGGGSGASNFWGFKVQTTDGSLIGRWYGSQTFLRGRNDYTTYTDQTTLGSGWQHLTMVINTSTSSVDYLLNNQLLGTIGYANQAWAGQSIGNMYFMRLDSAAIVGEEMYFDNLRIADSPLAPVPEPSSFAALGMFGLGALGYIKRRRA